MGDFSLSNYTNNEQKESFTTKPLEGGIYIDVWACMYIWVYMYVQDIYIYIQKGTEYSVPSTKWPVSKHNWHLNIVGSRRYGPSTWWVWVLRGLRPCWWWWFLITNHLILSHSCPSSHSCPFWVDVLFDFTLGCIFLHSSRLEMEWNGMVRSGVVWIGHSICMGPWPSIFKSAQCCAL